VACWTLNDFAQSLDFGKVFGRSCFLKSLGRTSASMGWDDHSLIPMGLGLIENKHACSSDTSKPSDTDGELCYCVIQAIPFIFGFVITYEYE